MQGRGVPITSSFRCVCAAVMPSWMRFCVGTALPFSLVPQGKPGI